MKIQLFKSITSTLILLMIISLLLNFQIDNKYFVRLNLICYTLLLSVLTFIMLLSYTFKQNDTYQTYFSK